MYYVTRDDLGKYVCYVIWKGRPILNQNGEWESPDSLTECYEEESTCRELFVVDYETYKNLVDGPDVAPGEVKKLEKIVIQLTPRKGD